MIRLYKVMCVDYLSYFERVYVGIDASACAFNGCSQILLLHVELQALSLLSTIVYISSHCSPSAGYVSASLPK
jgi:hypothetical protein